MFATTDPNARPPGATSLRALPQSRASELTSRDRALRACSCEASDRPPIWFMRQAGRCLPEYRLLRARHSFLDLVRTPDLAAEVTLQPIWRFQFDAAILFSDILVVPEAMGQGYRFRDQGGVEMDFAIRTRADIARITPDQLEERLEYVSQAISKARLWLLRTALIGFSGSPWTLANFMLEGGSSTRPVRALELMEAAPDAFEALLEKLTVAVIRFLRLQIAAGVDAIQIFDSHAGILSQGAYKFGSGRWTKRVLEELQSPVPVIVFAKGARDWPTLFNLGQQVLSLDQGVDLNAFRALAPESMALQGNFSPEMLLHLSPRELRIKTTSLLNTMAGRPGYIFNLGHGVPPTTPLENLRAVVDTVRHFNLP